MSTLKPRQSYKENFQYEGGSYPYPSSDRTFGWIFRENWQGLSSIPSYLVDTGCSPTFDGTDMSIGLLTAAGQVGNRIEYDYYQCFEAFYMEATIRLNYSEAAGKTGITLGVLKKVGSGDSFGNRSVAVWYRTDTNASNRRRIRIITGTNNNNYTTWNAQVDGPQIMTYASGDIIKLTLKKELGLIGSLYKASIQNLTSGLMSVIEWQENAAATTGDAYANATSRPFISTYTGEFDVLDWKFRGDDETGKHFLILGDSISHGLFASRTDNVWFRKINNVAAATGPNNTTRDILDMMSNAIAYKPEKVILFVGTNDVVNSVAQATREANYTSIVEQLEAAGIGVILCTALPRGNNNIYLNWNPFIRNLARQRGRYLIDFYELAVGYGSGINATNTVLFPDNTHPSDLMHLYMQERIMEFLNNLEHKT